MTAQFGCIYEKEECPSRQTIDSLWGSEVEGRIDADERGEMKAIPASGFFAKINQQ